MAAKGNVSSYKGDYYSFQIYTNALKSTACEWLLLLLLLLDGIFSYFITKFARYCELQLPCLFCSRIDHALGNDKLEFYRDLICCDHRLDLSSLVFCHSHYRLADAHEMCEECLLSFAKKESNQEVYKVLMSKLGADCLQKPFFNIDSVPGPMSTRCCSCCTKPWRSRPSVHKLVQAPGSASKPDIPLPKSPARISLNRQEGLKKRKDRFPLSTAPLLESADFDSLSNVGYSEVKINSDSESDFPFSDDDDLGGGPRDRKNMKGDHSKLLPNKQLDDFSSGAMFLKLPLSESNAMHAKHETEPKKGESISPNFMSPNGDLKHDETNWQRIREKVRPTVLECNPLEDIPLSTSAPEMSPALSPDDESKRVSLSKKFVTPGLQNLVFNKASQSKGMQLPVRLSKEKGTEKKENGDIEPSSATCNWESIDLNSTTNLKGTENDKKDSVSIGNSCSGTSVEDLSPCCRDKKFTEQPGKGDSNGIRSFAEPTTSKPLSTVNGHVDEMQMDDSSAESPMPPKSPIMPRSHPLESFEGSICEIEGESLVDKLKRQVEHDKQTIKNLNRELEEERNAAAIAANQAMAMITKLQEEKSALHMEALHYLRMLEEQAEYDVDELERSNDLLAEKENEIQDLEAELDYFKVKYPEDFPDDYTTLEQNEDLNDALLSNTENFKLDVS